MDYWTDIFLVFKHIVVAVVVSLIESFFRGMQSTTSVMKLAQDFAFNYLDSLLSCIVML